MQIIYQFDTHLDRREPTPILDAVQGESGRAVKVTFHEKGQPWPIPAGAHLLVRYGRPDHCGGVYDTLPDGAPACTVEGNTVTAVLVPQALAVAGHVSGQLAVISEGTELASFIFLVRVESDPSVGTAAAEDYVNLLPEVLEGIKDAKEAADRAEAAADRADQLAKKLNATIPLTFITGAISRETGAYLPNDNSTVSYYFPIIGGRIGLTIPSYFGGTIHYYDHQLTHLGYMELVYGATYDTPGYYEKQLTNGAKFARLVVQQMPSGTIEDTSAIRAYVTGSPGITPHIGQNGNWWIGSQDTGVSAGGKMYPLQIDSRKLMGFNLHGVYDGTETTMATVPTGFTFIEPSEYNPIPNTLYFHLGNMPAVLYGTFKTTANAETEYNFEFAYAFSGGYVDRNIANCVVIEPATGKIYRFAYTNENTCTVTESTIGESGGGDAPSGGGGEYRLAKSITLENDVSAIDITTDEDGNPLKFKEGLIEWNNPPSNNNCYCYLSVKGENADAPRVAFGMLASHSVQIKNYWALKSIAGRLLIETAETSTNPNADYGSLVAWKTTYDIGDITGFTMRDDGAKHMKTGATLNLYVKE